MLKRLHPFLLISSLLTPAHAMAMFPHGSNVAALQCPYGTGLGDGCAGAGSNNVFKAATFYGDGAGWYDLVTNASQQGSGQSWTSSHPWAWNAPGVDYAVAYDTATPLLDATTNLPAGCTYSATGSKAGGPYISCQSHANVTIDHLDFTMAGGATGSTCVQLEIKSTVTGTLTITNNKFQNNLNCATESKITAFIDDGSGAGSPAPAGHPGNVLTLVALISGAAVTTSRQVAGTGVSQLDGTCFYSIVSGSGTTWTMGNTSGCSNFANLQTAQETMYLSNNDWDVKIDTNAILNKVIENNLFDGNYPAVRIPLSATLVDDTSGCTTLSDNCNTDIEYNAFVRLPDRPISGAQFTTMNFLHNYVENGAGLGGQHGEIYQYNQSATSFTVNAENTAYNVAVTPSFVFPNCCTTTFYHSQGSNSGAVFTSTSDDHNVVVVNFATGFPTTTTVNATLEELNYNTFTAYSGTNNYIDWTGSNGSINGKCFRQNNTIGGTPTSPSFSGNVSLRTGNTITGMEVSVGTAGCN